MQPRRLRRNYGDEETFEDFMASGGGAKPGPSSLNLGSSRTGASSRYESSPVVPVSPNTVRSNMTKTNTSTNIDDFLNRGSYGTPKSRRKPEGSTYKSKPKAEDSLDLDELENLSKDLLKSASDIKTFNPSSSGKRPPAMSSSTFSAPQKFDVSPDSSEVEFDVDAITTKKPSSSGSRPPAPRDKATKSSAYTFQSSSRPSASGPPVASKECENCEESPATLKCPECDQLFCKECDTAFHRPVKLSWHKREPIRSSASHSAMSSTQPKPLNTQSGTAHTSRSTHSASHTKPSYSSGSKYTSMSGQRLEQPSSPSRNRPTSPSHKNPPSSSAHSSQYNRPVSPASRFKRPTPLTGASNQPSTVDRPSSPSRYASRQQQSSQYDRNPRAARASFLDKVERSKPMGGLSRGGPAPRGRGRSRPRPRPKAKLLNFLARKAAQVPLPRSDSDYDVRGSSYSREQSYRGAQHTPGTYGHSSPRAQKTGASQYGSQRGPAQSQYGSQRGGQTQPQYGRYSKSGVGSQPGRYASGPAGRHQPSRYGDHHKVAFPKPSGRLLNRLGARAARFRVPQDDFDYRSGASRYDATRGAGQQYHDRPSQPSTNTYSSASRYGTRAAAPQPHTNQRLTLANLGDMEGENRALEDELDVIQAQILRVYTGKMPRSGDVPLPPFYQKLLNCSDLNFPTDPPMSARDVLKVVVSVLDSSPPLLTRNTRLFCNQSPYPLLSLTLSHFLKKYHLPNKAKFNLSLFVMSVAFHASKLRAFGRIRFFAAACGISPLEHIASNKKDPLSDRVPCPFYSDVKFSTAALTFYLKLIKRCRDASKPSKLVECDKGAKGWISRAAVDQILNDRRFVTFLKGESITRIDSFLLKNQTRLKGRNLVDLDLFIDRMLAEWAFNETREQMNQEALYLVAHSQMRTITFLTFSQLINICAEHPVDTIDCYQMFVKTLSLSHRTGTDLSLGSNGRITMAAFCALLRSHGFTSVKNIHPHHIFDMLDATWKSCEARVEKALRYHDDHTLRDAHTRFVAFHSDLREICRTQREASVSVAERHCILAGIRDLRRLLLGTGIVERHAPGTGDLAIADFRMRWLKVWQVTAKDVEVVNRGKQLLREQSLFAELSHIIKDIVSRLHKHDFTHPLSQHIFTAFGLRLHILSTIMNDCARHSKSADEMETQARIKFRNFLSSVVYWSGQAESEAMRDILTWFKVFLGLHAHLDTDRGDSKAMRSLKHMLAKEKHVSVDGAASVASEAFKFFIRLLQTMRIADDLFSNDMSATEFSNFVGMARGDTLIAANLRRAMISEGQARDYGTPPFSLFVEYSKKSRKTTFITLPQESRRAVSVLAAVLQLLEYFTNDYETHVKTAKEFYSSSMRMGHRRQKEAPPLSLYELTLLLNKARAVWRRTGKVTPEWDTFAYAMALNSGWLLALDKSKGAEWGQSAITEQHFTQLLNVVALRCHPPVATLVPLPDDDDNELDSPRHRRRRSSDKDDFQRSYKEAKRREKSKDRHRHSASPNRKASKYGRISLYSSSESSDSGSDSRDERGHRRKRSASKKKSGRTKSTRKAKTPVRTRRTTSVKKKPKALSQSVRVGRSSKKSTKGSSRLASSVGKKTKKRKSKKTHRRSRSSDSSESDSSSSESSEPVVSLRIPKRHGPSKHRGRSKSPLRRHMAAPPRDGPYHYVSYHIAESMSKADLHVKGEPVIVHDLEQACTLLELERSKSDTLSREVEETREEMQDLNERYELEHEQLMKKEDEIVTLQTDLRKAKENTLRASYRELVSSGRELKSSFMDEPRLHALQREMKEMDHLIKSLNAENAKLVEEKETWRKRLRDVDGKDVAAERHYVREIESLRLRLQHFEEKERSRSLAADLKSPSYDRHRKSGHAYELGLGMDARSDLERRNVELQRENEFLRKEKRELEYRFGGVEPGAFDGGNSVVDSLMHEIGRVKQQKDKDIHELKRRLEWYVENQKMIDIMERDLHNRTVECQQWEQKYIELEDEYVRNDEARGRGGARARGRAGVKVPTAGSTATRLRKKSQRSQETKQKRINELEQTVKDLQAIIRKRHPDSVTSIIHATRPSVEETHTVKRLREQVADLQTQLNTKDEELVRKLRGLRQQHEQVKLLYDKRMNALRTQVKKADQQRGKARGPRATNQRVAELEKQLKDVRSYYMNKIKALKRSQSSVSGHPRHHAPEDALLGVDDYGADEHTHRPNIADMSYSLPEPWPNPTPHPAPYSSPTRRPRKPSPARPRTASPTKRRGTQHHHSDDILQDKLATAEERLQRAEQQLEEKQEEVMRLLRDAARWEAEASQLSAALDHTQRRLRDVEDDRNRLRDDNVALQYEINRVKLAPHYSDYQGLVDKIEAMEGKHVAREQELQHIITALKESAAHDRAEQHRRYEDLKKEKNAQIAKFKVELDDLLDALGSVQGQVQRSGQPTRV